MSLSLIAFQPAIEEPSNMKPSVSMSSSMTEATIVKCCHLPLGSVNRRSTYSISLSSICFRILDAALAMVDPIWMQENRLGPGLWLCLCDSSRAQRSHAVRELFTGELLEC